jgi:hypothetical protein
MGLVGLLRTSPSQHSSQPYKGLHDEDPKPRHRNDAGNASPAAFADAAKEKVQDWSAHTGEAARQIGTQIADKAASVADRASRRLRDTVPNQDDRDTYLLGAAALAVAAAVGIAFQRRTQEDMRPPIF